jgi:hypothetical protein
LQGTAIVYLALEMVFFDAATIGRCSRQACNKACENRSMLATVRDTQNYPRDTPRQFLDEAATRLRQGTRQFQRARDSYFVA